MIEFLQQWSWVLYGLVAAWAVAEVAAGLGVTALAAIRESRPWTAATRAAAGVLLLLALAAGHADDYRPAHPEALLLLWLLPLVAWWSMSGLSGLTGTRRKLAVLLRCLCLLLLIVALADIRKRRLGDDVAVIVLLDVSSSVPEELRVEAIRAINTWAEKAGAKDRLKVITFAGDARTETPFLNRLKIYELTQMPKRTDQTDLAGAMRLALDSFPPDTRRRLVVISDGNQNVGDARAEAAAAAARGIPIDTVTLDYGSGDRNELMVDSVRAPASIGDKETVDITVGIRTMRSCRARVRLFDGGASGRELKISGPESRDPWVEVDLEGGGGSRGKLNTVVISRPGVTAGLHRWRVEVEPISERLGDGTPSDTRKANNVGTAITVASGTPEVLLVCPEPEREKRLVAAFNVERLGIRLKVIRPSDLPDRAELFAFDAIVFADVPASDVPEAKRAEIEQFVKETGGGFVMIGGENGFGAGLWTGTPVEKCLPVEMEVKNVKVRQKGALVLVMHACEMPEGNYWSIQVATAAIKAMSRLDEVGVVEYAGGAAANWVVPLQVKSDEARILALVQKMALGDMPDLDAVVAAAHFSLAASDASNKHIIVISDGDPRMPSPPLVAKLRADVITVSAVAVSPHALTPVGPDISGFEQLVQATNQKGRGKFYIVDTPDRRKSVGGAITVNGRTYRVHSSDDLPRIFLQETHLVRRPMLKNVPEGFQPIPQRTGAPPSDDPTHGLDLSRLPKLRGYVLTQAKPSAFVPIVSPLKAAAEDNSPDPILAHWRYGIGKAVAWTSDTRDQWAADWVKGDPMFERLWEQIIRWVRRPPQDPDVSASLVREGDLGRLTVRAVDAGRRVRTDVAFVAAVLTPDGKTRDVTLMPTAAGAWTGTFRLDGKGTYMAVARYRADSGSGGSVGPERFARVGLDVAYEDEFRTWTADPSLMAAITAAGAPGGKALVGASAAKFADLAVFRREGLAEAETWQSLSLSWEFRQQGGWLGKASDAITGMPLPGWLAVLFLIDVLVRRVAVDPIAVLRRLLAWTGLLRTTGPVVAGADGPAVDLGALRSRTRRTANDGAAAEPREPTVPSRPGSGPDTPVAEPTAPNQPPVPPSMTPPSPTPPTASDAGDALGRLRAAKRRARDDMEHRN